MGAAWIGLSGIALSTGLAFVFAGTFSFFGIICGRMKRLKAFPFGPFIAISIWAVWLFEPSLWSKQWVNFWGI